MRVIGITGGIGAGKSEILSFLQRNYRARILQTDLAAHHLMEPGNATYYPIVEQFGSRILNGDMTVNRQILGRIVREDFSAWEQLNRIVHPRVKEYVVGEIKRAKADGMEYFFVEAALLIEDHYDLICDELWYIYADEELRRKRLRENRMYTEEKINQIFERQLKDEEFRAHCQVVIDNSKDLEYTFRQIRKELGA